MGNRLSKIYTRTGDNGSTGMADGSRLSKADIVFMVMGDVDEVNAHIGMIRALLPALSKTPPPSSQPIISQQQSAANHCKVSHYQHQLSVIQHILFNVGGELAMPEYQGVQSQHINWLEESIDAMNTILPPLKDFILPAGEQLTCQIHIARTVCRRAERQAARLMSNKADALSTPTYQFINRLSDWLFVFARLSTHPLFLNNDQTDEQKVKDGQTHNQQKALSNEVLWDKNVLANFD